MRPQLNDFNRLCPSQCCLRFFFAFNRRTLCSRSSRRSSCSRLPMSARTFLHLQLVQRTPSTEYNNELMCPTPPNEWQLTDRAVCMNVRLKGLHRMSATTFASIQCCENVSTATTTSACPPAAVRCLHSPVVRPPVRQRHSVASSVVYHQSDRCLESQGRVREVKWWGSVCGDSTHVWLAGEKLAWLGE